MKTIIEEKYIVDDPLPLLLNTSYFYVNNTACRFRVAARTTVNGNRIYAAGLALYLAQASQGSGMTNFQNQYNSRLILSTTQLILMIAYYVA